MVIKLSSNTIPNEHIDKLSEWLTTYPKLTKGAQTDKFEKEFSRYLAVNHARLVNSGSSANLLMAAANLFYKDLRNKKVAVPAVSWSTTLSPFVQLGYNPYLIDCDPKNLGVNIDHLYSLIKSEDISTLILVHVLGHESSLDKVIDICQERDIRLFEDTCESIGSILNKKKLGTFGLASSFSFYYGHHMSTIEGGAVCSNCLDFIELVTSLRSHGWNRDLQTELSNKLKTKYSITDFRNLYSFYYPGFNFRPTEINAYLGCLQINILNKYCKRRFELFSNYKENLAEFWTQESNCEFLSAFAFGTLISNPEEVWEYLKSRNIESRPLICGSMGLQPFWKENTGKYLSLRYADQVHKYGIYLPINADMDLEDVNTVCNEFKKVAIPYKFI